MPTSQPSQDRATPDHLLHTCNGTDVTPEDVVLATGRDLTPSNLEWARRKLDEDPNTIEKLLP